MLARRQETFGYPAGGSYVNTFWAPVLGPSTVLLWPRLVSLLDESPQPVDVDLLAALIGVQLSVAERSLQRIERFHLAHRDEMPFTEVLVVHTHAPRLSSRQLARLPALLRKAHARWPAVGDTRAVGA